MKSKVYMGKEMTKGEKASRETTTEGRDRWVFVNKFLYCTHLTRLLCGLTQQGLPEVIFKSCQGRRTLQIVGAFLTHVWFLICTLAVAPAVGSHGTSPAPSSFRPKFWKVLLKAVKVAAVIGTMLFMLWFPNYLVGPAPVPGDVPLVALVLHPTDEVICQQIPSTTFEETRFLYDRVKGCLICQLEDVFQADDIISVIPSCEHPFHTECLQVWMETADACPICRIKIGLDRVSA